MKLASGTPNRGLIDPEAYVCSIEQDVIDSRLGVVMSTVRPFDRQRAKTVGRGRPAIRATIKFAPQTFLAASARPRTGRRVISSGRPA